MSYEVFSFVFKFKVTFQQSFNQNYIWLDFFSKKIADCVCLHLIFSFHKL